jgi:hypothetical protein
MTQTLPISAEQVEAAARVLAETEIPPGHDEQSRKNLVEICWRDFEETALATLTAAASIPASRGVETPLHADGLTAAAKVIAADVIGYAWDGMGENSITDKGFKPLIYSAHGGLKFQGGHKDLEQYAASIVSAYLAASPQSVQEQEPRESTPEVKAICETLDFLRRGAHEPYWLDARVGIALMRPLLKAATKLDKLERSASPPEQEPIEIYLAVDHTGCIHSSQDKEHISGIARQVQDTAEGKVERLTEALRNIEDACDDLAGTRSDETYLRMIDVDGATGALERLDAAHSAARAALEPKP